MSSALPSFLAASVLLAATVHAAEPDLRIVSAAAVSLREAPGVSSATRSRLPLGTVVDERTRTGGVDTVGGETAPWFLVATPSGEENWLFGALTLPYAEAEKDALALEIADGRLKRERDPFESLAELHERFSAVPAAEEIAWDAARALLPGECEGEIPCHVGVVARTCGRYLGLCPKGAHASAALAFVATEGDTLAEDPRTQDLAGSVPPGEVDALRNDLGTLKRVLAPIADPRAAVAAATLDARRERLAPRAGARP